MKRRKDIPEHYVALVLVTLFYFSILIYEGFSYVIK